MFAFTLARLLGCFAEDVLDRMSAREFAEWHVVLSTNPEDLRPPPGVEDTEAQLKKLFGVSPD